MTDGPTHGRDGGIDRAEERAARIGALLREARAERFGPGFADRVMRAVDVGASGAPESAAHRTWARDPGSGHSGIGSGTRVPAFASALTAQFLRLAPLAAALIAGLFVYNVWIAGSGRPTLDDALGLRPVTFGEAYSLEALLLEGAPAEGPQ